MNNNETLVIIDMQDYFDNSQKCLPGVLKEIEAAKATKTPILVVEYVERDGSKFSDTNRPILDAIKGYRHKAFVKKSHDGGGYEVAEVAIEKGFSLKHIRMVGVNRTYCVYSTALQLKKIQKEDLGGGFIEVVRGASACNGSTMNHGLRELKKLGCHISYVRRQKALTSKRA